MRPVLYARLSAMMFLEYFVWGLWYVTMGTYLLNGLNFTDVQVAGAYGTGAIAAMISPFFIGLIADRFFPTERVLGVMHLLGAALMYAASTAQQFGAFYPLLLGYTICYMPTIALSNGVSFHQMDNPGKQFPYVRVWGTIGWIGAGLLIGWMQVEKQVLPLQLAAAASVLLGLYSFTLPHTPPKDKGKQIGIREVLGLDAVSLLRQRPFLVLFLASVLICIPLMYYYTFTNPFLNEIGVVNAAGKQTLGQMSELGFLLLMPALFMTLGVKRLMIIGMLAWALRYVLFAFGNAADGMWMLYAGIVLHGICYDFFFVTGQIYADQRAPLNLRSSVQGMMTFATYGIGMFLGSLVSGVLVEMGKTGSDPVQHDWMTIWLIPAGFAVLVALGYSFFFPKDKARSREAAKAA
ncbi:MAG: nucleoside permease [Bacteroidia bacterium]|nr:nucleoside permease [Bacteroidia bacterium]